LPFDRSAPDLTAHALEAWDAWFPLFPASLQQRIRGAARRAVAYLKRTQHADGSWTPLWFGNQHADQDANRTDGSSRSAVALDTRLAREISDSDAEACRRRAVVWLLRAQEADGGWGGAAGVRCSIEETGLALHALAIARDRSADHLQAIGRGVDWLIGATSEGRRTPPSPIGFYFARLWYDEALYPVVFALRGLIHARAALLSSGEST
jgi:squalene-hopene/tetraprenyl-beta-curcumene cyclase